MDRFAALLDRLALTPQRNAKLRLLTDYFATVPDPHRGYAVAAITRDLEIAAVKPAMLRALVTERVDETLFGWSYDYVGDLAETIALIWPAPAAPGSDQTVPSLGEIVDRLRQASRSDGPALVEALLDRLDPTARWALIKLVTGGLRIGVSARLAKQALADFGGKSVSDIEEVWHALEPPFAELFAWLEDRGPRPQPSSEAPFRPVMLSHPLETEMLPEITPDAFAAEWKWDGIRIQLVREGGICRLYSRTGEDISAAFPEVVEAVSFDGAVDGELLIGDPAADRIGTFSDLQQRLNRKTVDRKLIASHPAFVRAYDCLTTGGDDVRPSPFAERRQRLEALLTAAPSPRLDLSPLLSFADGDGLTALRAAPPEPVIEGVMLKRWDSPYIPGRPKGHWYKWKRDPHLVDAVVMYAQRGHGRRSSFYSDYTFGLWRTGEAGEELVPVGKAYFGFTDEELTEIDRFVRQNTINRFGPVREVAHEPDRGLVVEVAFEGLAWSTRHKSGVAMRFPRISRLRWDKPPAEADRLDLLEKLLDR